jgi:hypothetical protein
MRLESKKDEGKKKDYVLIIILIEGFSLYLKSGFNIKNRL